MDGYSYDATGNLLGDGVHTYTYDAENRLIKVDNGNTATYSYDADGRRAQKIQPGINLQFTYDLSGRLMKRFDGIQYGNFSQGNFYAGSRHVATIGGGTTFSHSDWLGTERARTSFINSVWNLCETIASLPFGDGQTTTPMPGFGFPYGCNPASPLHFTGKERDSESGLDNFGARFDSSSMGRFMSPDWSASPAPVPFADLDDPQSLNLYAYVKNNPINRIDAGGHQGKEQLPGTNYTILKHKENPNDMPNIHVYDKSGNEAGQLRFNGRGESRWEGVRNLSSEAKQQVEAIARAEGYAARAVERQTAMSAARAARGSGTVSRAITVAMIADMILNSIYVHKTEKDEAKTGWHFDPVRDTNVITDVDKAAKSFAAGSEITSGSELTHDLDTYTLGNDGKWRDSQGNYLFNCEVDGKQGVCSTKGMA